jgi:hypothetical protein
MSDFNQTFFGPLSKEYCIWFYFLSLWFFIGLVIVIVSGLIIGIKQNKDLSFYFNVLTVSVIYAAFYFQNRLLYSMCLGNR